MKIVAFTAIALISSALAVEEHIPKTIYAQKSFCAGDNLRLSCADDGKPFLDYTMSVVGIRVFTAESPSRQCSVKMDFLRDEDLCDIDTESETSEFTGLLLEIESVCTDQKECFVRLPESKELSSSKLCDKLTYFHSVSVEFTCKEPGATYEGGEPTRTQEESDSEDDQIDWTKEVPTTTKKSTVPQQHQTERQVFGFLGNAATTARVSALVMMMGAAMFL